MTNEDLTSQPHEPGQKFRPSSAAKVGLITATLTALGIVFVTTHQLLLLLLTYGRNAQETARPVFTSETLTLSFLPFGAGLITIVFVIVALVKAWLGNKTLGAAIAWSLLPALLATFALDRGMARSAFSVPVFLMAVISILFFAASEYRRSTPKLIALTFAFLALSVPVAAVAEAAVIGGYEERVGKRITDQEVAKLFTTGSYEVSVDQSFSNDGSTDKQMVQATFDFSDCTETGTANNSTEWVRVKNQYFYNVDSEGWWRDDLSPAPVSPLLWALMPSSEQSAASDYGVCKGIQQLANVASISRKVETNEGSTYILHFDGRRAESAADRRSWEMATKVLGLSGVPAILINQIAFPAFNQFFADNPEIQLDVNKAGTITQMRMLLDKNGTARTIETYRFKPAARPTVKTPDYQEAELNTDELKEILTS